MCIICTVVAQRFFQYIFENTAIFKFKDSLDLLYLQIRVGNMQISMAFAYQFFSGFFLNSEILDSPVVKDARQQAPEKKHSSVISFLFCLDRGNGEEILNRQLQVFVFKCFFQVKLQIWISNSVVEIPCVFLTIRPNSSYPI